MTLDDVFCHTFKALSRQLRQEARQGVDFILPSMPMVDACRADGFSFFKPLIDSGRLSDGQAVHAATRYHLGKTRAGTPVFWMIDEMVQPLDAHIGEDWISRMLKRREPLLEGWQVQHCLFGLHLLAEERSLSLPVSIVESEASAVVLSELFPESLWMAYATMWHLVPDLLAPLEGRTVILFPRTDPTMDNYLFFRDYADSVSRAYPGIDIAVDATLEDHASGVQREHCTDILGFLADSWTEST